MVLAGYRLASLMRISYWTLRDFEPAERNLYRPASKWRLAYMTGCVKIDTEVITTASTANPKKIGGPASLCFIYLLSHLLIAHRKTTIPAAEWTLPRQRSQSGDEPQRKWLNGAPALPYVNNGSIVVNRWCDPLRGWKTRTKSLGLSAACWRATTNRSRQK